ncbi:MAG: CocE/NonD family hydrolase C-terminal non-catalytic domain-containing protein [Pasteurellaceae bacterium]|nr:CocE/NonD family hydrolase C-terminal non-catalytic domain-containing protein [Pasteurellaceae bacterium]
MRVHNTHEWIDYHTPKYVQELLAFFDHFLKGEQNGWENTPNVRISILDPNGEDVVDQAVPEWPPRNVRPTELFLNSNDQLSTQCSEDASNKIYSVDDPNGATFTYVFEQDCDVVGYMALRLWLEAQGSDDMEIAVTAEKYGKNGEHFANVTEEGLSGSFAATGYLRVSQRELDQTCSTEFEPYLKHTNEQRLTQGEIVEVNIPLWPMATRYRKGEQLRLIVKAYRPVTSVPLHFGEAPVEIAASGATFAPNKSDEEMVSLGGSPEQSPDYVHQQRFVYEQSRNRGEHIIHFGGQYNSRLLIPVVE